MPKKILLIENDSAFSDAISGALETTGFETRATVDGKEGLELAREWSPDAIVLCVEMSGVSGYLVCQKLKKDAQLKTIPLVLTSAEATEETFEKHRTLKARADEYLLKPYEPAALIDKLSALVGLPEGAEAGADDHEEELVSLEEEIDLEATEEPPGAEPSALDLQSLPDEPPASERTGDDDFKLLDDAFDGLSSRAPPAAPAAFDLDLAGEKPVRGDDVDAAAASLPDEDEGAARADLGGFGDEADQALGALGGEDESLSPEPPEPEPELEKTRTHAVRGASADLLRAAGISLLDDDRDRAPAAAVAPATRTVPAMPSVDLAFDRSGSAGNDEELDDLRRRNDDLTRQAEESRAELDELKRRNDELAHQAEEAQSEAKKLRAQVRRAEADLDASRDESRRVSEQGRDVEAEIAELRRKVAEAENDAHDATEAKARVDAVERELDEMRTELLVARGEADGARGEVEKRTAELRDRLAELEAESSKNEERIVKAYQKIKADEKIRDKVRKALAIATQLLDEGPDASAENRRAPSAVGRE